MYTKGHGKEGRQGAANWRLECNFYQAGCFFAPPSSARTLHQGRARIAVVGVPGSTAACFWPLAAGAGQAGRDQGATTGYITQFDDKGRLYPGWFSAYPSPRLEFRTGSFTFFEFLWTSFGQQYRPAASRWPLQLPHPTSPLGVLFCTFRCRARPRHRGERSWTGTPHRHTQHSPTVSQRVQELRPPASQLRRAWEAGWKGGGWQRQSPGREP